MPNLDIATCDSIGRDLVVANFEKNAPWIRTALRAPCTTKLCSFCKDVALQILTQCYRENGRHLLKFPVQVWTL